MSFYGQVVYEFTKLFSKFKIGETILEAENIWDQIELTNDKWIVLTGDKDENDNKTISIKHNIPQETTRSQSSFSKFDDESEPDKAIAQLQYGDMVEAATYNFDELGHLTGTETNYYKLPTLDIKYGAEEGEKISPSENIISIEGDDWIHINGKADEMLSFTHGNPKSLGAVDFTTLNWLDNKTGLTNKELIIQGAPEGSENIYDTIIDGKTVYDLHPGELMRVYAAEKDEKGHITSIEEKYIKLPISADTAMFEENQARIINLENRLGGQKDTDGPLDKPYENVVEDLYKEEDGLYTRVDTLESNSVQKEGFTGELTDMYEEGNEKTFAETIGKVDSDTEGSIRSSIRSLLELRPDEEPEKIYSIAEAIFYLSNKLQEIDTEIYNLGQANKGIKIDIEDLSQRIEKLENPTE